jgi:hypothetical protein
MAASRRAPESPRRTWALGAFVGGFTVSAVAIKQAWGPAYTYESLSGVIVVVGVVVGGVCAGVAFIFASIRR